MSLLKRIERYGSAIFKLGRTARLAKTASQATAAIEPRLDVLDAEQADTAGRVEEVAGALDAHGAAIRRIEARLDAIEHRLEWAADREPVDARFADIETRLDAAAEAAARVGALSERVAAQTGEIARAQEAASGTAGHLAAAERRLGDRFNEVRADADRLAARLDAAVPRLDRIEPRLARLVSDGAQSARAYSDLSRRLDVMRFGQGEGATPAAPGVAAERRAGLDALLDSFYNRLEDRFRGTRAEIKGKLETYLPAVSAAAEATGRPVFDFGCGRGEWLELLRDHGIAGRGVDLNPVQLEDAHALGLDVAEGDALEALAAAPDGAFAAVTAHHVVEHLPFDTVVWIARESLRVLAPGGLLILETPNPRNLIVGATTFHIDPTHLKPRPEELLTTVLDTVGYHPVEARAMHPYDDLDDILARGDIQADVVRLLFGPQDLAVTGTRPAAG